MRAMLVTDAASESQREVAFDVRSCFTAFDLLHRLRVAKSYD